MVWYRNFGQHHNHANSLALVRNGTIKWRFAQGTSSITSCSIFQKWSTPLFNRTMMNTSLVIARRDFGTFSIRTGNFWVDLAIAHCVHSTDAIQSIEQNSTETTMLQSVRWSTVTCMGSATWTGRPRIFKLTLLALDLNFLLCRVLMKLLSSGLERTYDRSLDQPLGK